MNDLGPRVGLAPAHSAPRRLDAIAYGQADPETLQARYLITVARNDPQRPALLDEFHRRMAGLYERTARNLLAAAGHYDHNLVADATQKVAMVAVALLDDPAARGVIEAHPFRALVIRRSKSQVRDWTFSVEVSGISGASGALRRNQRAMRTIRSAEVAAGRVLTEAEALVVAQEQVTRADSSSKGGTVSPADLAGYRSLPTGPEDMTGTRTVDPSSATLDPIDAAEMIASVISAAALIDNDMATVAEVWLSAYDPAARVFDSLGVLELRTALIAATGRQWSMREVGNLRARVCHLAITILASDFGIDDG